MFSAVGWICVQEAEYLDEFGDPTSVSRRPSLDAVEAALDRLVPPTLVVWPKRSLRARLAAVMQQATWEHEPHKPLPGPEALFRADNGRWTVLIDTHRNHRRDWPEQLFREVAQIAPGSFGFLHIWDDVVDVHAARAQAAPAASGSGSLGDEPQPLLLSARACADSLDVIVLTTIDADEHVLRALRAVPAASCSRTLRL